MKKRTMFTVLFYTLLLLAFTTAAAYAQETEDKTLAPYFLVEGADPSVDSLPLKKTDVTVHINGIIADIYVTQTYQNEGSTPLNAGYIFPASTQAAVHGMKMVIGDQVVTARIKEREEAREEFESAKSEGKSTSLLEQERPNVFSMNVANIMPGDTVEIELHFTELIRSSEGIYEFVFPTVVGPRYASAKEYDDSETEWVQAPYLKEGTEPEGEYNITVNLTAGVPISDLSCASHQVKISKSNESTARITLSDQSSYAGNRDYILNYKLTGEAISSGLMLQTGESENFFMLMVQPPERIIPEEIPAREYIFVLDVSGSMHGFPLDTAKELLRKLVSGLDESDRFNVILFSGAAVELSSQSLPATAKNIELAVDLINDHSAGGGTELAAALETAIAMPADPQTARSIIVVTDGYISAEKEIFDLIGKHLGNTSFFSFGIGDSVNRYLVEGIAKAGLGEAFIVSDPDQAAETAGRFRTYIQSPILTDIRVTYEGFEVYDIEPAAIPTLFGEKPIIIYGKWRGEPSGTIQLTGTTGAGDYTHQLNVSDSKPSADNEALRYLWARKRVERLTDYGYNKNEEATKKEVTELGLTYSMMTPYTSFIAVIDTVRNPDGNSKDVNQALPLPQNVSNLAVGGYTVGSEPGMIAFVLFGIFAALSGLLSYLNKNRSIGK